MKFKCNLKIYYLKKLLDVKKLFLKDINVLRSIFYTTYKEDVLFLNYLTLSWFLIFKKNINNKKLFEC